MFKFKNQQGMSLIEVMMSAAIGAGLALTMASMTTNLQRGIKSAERGGDWVDLKNTLRLALSSERNCQTLFNLPALNLNESTIETVGELTVPNLNIGTTASPQSVGVGSTYGSGIRFTAMRVGEFTHQDGTIRYTAPFTVVISANRSDTSRETLGIQEYRQTWQVTFFNRGSHTTPTNHPIDSCVGSDSDIGSMNEQLKSAVPRDSFVIAQSEPADCIAITGAEITTCIAAASTANAKQLFIKNGTYTSVCDVTLLAGMSLTGAGEETVLTAPTSGTCQGILRPANYSTVSRIKFNLGAGVISGVYAGQVSNVTLEKLRITGTPRVGGSGIRLEGSSATAMEAIIIKENEIMPSGSITGFVGIKLHNSGTGGSANFRNLHINNNIVRGVSSNSDSMAIQSINTGFFNAWITDNQLSAGTSVIGSTNSGTGVSIDTRAISNLKIEGNEIMGQRGVSVTGQGDTTTNVSGLSVSNNRIIALEYGVHMDSFRNNDIDATNVSNGSTLVRGNTIRHLASTPTVGVGIGILLVNNTLKNAIIRENSISIFAQGIRLSGRLATSPDQYSDQVIVSDNKLESVIMGITVDRYAAIISSNTISAGLVGINQLGGSAYPPSILDNRISISSPATTGATFTSDTSTQSIRTAVSLTPASNTERLIRGNYSNARLLTETYSVRSIVTDNNIFSNYSPASTQDRVDTNNINALVKSYSGCQSFSYYEPAAEQPGMTTLSDGTYGTGRNGSHGEIFMGCPAGKYPINWGVKCSDNDTISAIVVRKKNLGTDTTFWGVYGDCDNTGGGGVDAPLGGTLTCCNEAFNRVP